MQLSGNSGEISKGILYKNITMAESESDKRNVLLCVDNSGQAEWAFECKFCIVVHAIMVCCGFAKCDKSH